MENASKALLIAAGVLVAIIIITIGIKVYTSTSGTDKIASKVGSDVSQKTGEASDLAVSEITNSNIPKGLKVGDTVYYDHTKGKNGKSLTNKTYISNRFNLKIDIDNYNDGWKVLEINNGKIELISANSVKVQTKNSSPWWIVNTYDLMKYGDIEVKNACNIYNQGKGAESARSINLDDINRITGYSPQNFGKGTKYEYGTTVTFYWDGTNYPYYKCSNGIQGSLSNSHNYFYYYENGDIKSKAKSQTATKENMEEITTLKNDGFVLFLNEIKNLDINSKEYKLLFDTESYFIANRGYSNWYSEFGFFGYNKINRRISVEFNYDTYGNTGYVEKFYIRPIIILSKDVKLKGNSEQGWTIQ